MIRQAVGSRSEPAAAAAAEEDKADAFQEVFADVNAGMKKQKDELILALNRIDDQDNKQVLLHDYVADKIGMYMMRMMRTMSQVPVFAATTTTAPVSIPRVAKKVKDLDEGLKVSRLIFWILFITKRMKRRRRRRGKEKRQR
jgi:hypothetical protein